MAKLNMWEKEEYSINMELAIEGNIVFAQSEDKMITVAIMPNDRMGSFMRVFVAYCGNETPKRKRGINAVMNRYADDNYILVPATFRHTPKDSALRILAIIEDNFF